MVDERENAVRRRNRSGAEQDVQPGLEPAALVAEIVARIAPVRAARLDLAPEPARVVGMDQVALAMENIKQASAQNMAGTKQAEIAAQSLHEIGVRLRLLVDR